MTSPNIQAYKQEDWEGPLDYTKPSRQREEEMDEVGTIAPSRSTKSKLLVFPVILVTEGALQHK